MTLNFQMDCAVAPIVPAAFPWYAFRNDIMSLHPVYSLAIIIANSFASVPEFVKNTTYIHEEYISISLPTRVSP